MHRPKIVGDQVLDESFGVTLKVLEGFATKHISLFYEYIEELLLIKEKPNGKD